MRSVAVALFCALWGGSCTLLVIDDLVRAACTDVSDCAAGDACIDGACAPVASLGPPPAGAPVGPEGARVEGPDGIIFDIPPFATDVVLRVRIERRSSTTVPVGVLDRSRFYAVVPIAALTLPAVLAVPLQTTLETGEGACADCSLWLAPASDDEPWTALAPALAPAGFVGGELTALGAVVVAGVAAP